MALRSRSEVQAMPDITTQPGQKTSGEEVLTLAEAADYLRVPEAALVDLVNQQEIPAQKIGGEWRLLKRALTDWLRFGPRLYHVFHDLKKLPAPWVFDHPLWEDFCHMLADRVIAQLK